MLESSFQNEVIKELGIILPGAIILKNDANYIQGFPDLTILWNGFWCVLECKRSINEQHRPNQEYYVAYCNAMSFARTIYPENREEILYEIQQASRGRG